MFCPNVIYMSRRAYVCEMLHYRFFFFSFFLQCIMYKVPFYYIKSEWRCHSVVGAHWKDISPMRRCVEWGGKLEDLHLCSIDPQQSINVTNPHGFLIFCACLLLFQHVRFDSQKSNCAHFYTRLTGKQMGCYFVGFCGLNPTKLSRNYIFQWSYSMRAPFSGFDRYRFLKGDALITKSTCQYWNWAMFLVWICV